MNSTPNPNTGNPDDVLTARADERLAHAYEQIAHADEQLAHLTEQLSKLEDEAARQPSAVAGLRQSRGRPALRGLVGFLLAACIGAAAFVSQSSYGEAARLTIAQWAPHLIPASSLPSEKPGDSVPPDSSGVRVAAAEPIPVQATGSVQTSAPDAAPASALASPELTQLLQSMLHDIASVEQGIEQLKANQEQMAADNAKAIEQLKASQEQLARLIPKPSEPDARAKTPAPPPKPVVNAAARKPPTPQPPQARARSQPVQLQPQVQ